METAEFINKIEIDVYETEFWFGSLVYGIYLCSIFVVKYVGTILVFFTKQFRFSLQTQKNVPKNGYL